MSTAARADAEASPLLTAPVTPTLFRMGVPIGLGMLSTFLFQVVDRGDPSGQIQGNTPQKLVVIAKLGRLHVLRLQIAIDDRINRGICRRT